MVQLRPGALPRRRVLRAPRGPGRHQLDECGPVVAHGGGRYTCYGHLGAFRVPFKAEVAAGQLIGLPEVARYLYRPPRDRARCAEVISAGATCRG